MNLSKFLNNKSNYFFLLPSGGDISWAIENSPTNAEQNAEPNTISTRPLTTTRGDRVFERLRVKNDLLVSQIDEMDWVEHDQSISTGDEEEDDDEEENLGAMTDENLEDLDEEVEDELEKEFVQYVLLFVFVFHIFIPNHWLSIT